MKRKRYVIAIAIMALMLSGCSSSGEESKETSTSSSESESVEMSSSEEVTEAETTAVSDSIPGIKFIHNYKEWYSDDNEQVLVSVNYDTVEIVGEDYPELSEAISKRTEEMGDKLISAGEAALEEAQATYTATPDAAYITNTDDQLLCTRIDSNVLSLRRYSYLYAGGAYGNYEYTGLNYDAKTGKELDLTDVVTDMDTFKSMAKEDIMTELADYADYLDEGYETAIDEMLDGDSLCWYMDAAGINLCINPYIVGPHALGTINVVLPYADYESCMNSEYIKAKGNCVAMIPDTESITYYLSGVTDKELMIELSDDTNNIKTTLVYGDNKYTDTTQEQQDYNYGYVLVRDDEVYVIYGIDLGSGAYIAYLYNINSDEAVLSDELSGGNMSLGDIDLDHVDMKLYMDALGTYATCMTYTISSEGKLVAEDEFFKVIGAEYSTRNLVAKQDIKVTVDGKERVLPVGTTVRVTGTNGVDKITLLIVDSNEEAIVEYTKSEGTYEMMIDGISEYDYFDNIPYAG